MVHESVDWGTRLAGAVIAPDPCLSLARVARAVVGCAAVALFGVSERGVEYLASVGWEYAPSRWSGSLADHPALGAVLRSAGPLLLPQGGELPELPGALELSRGSLGELGRVGPIGQRLTVEGRAVGLLVCWSGLADAEQSASGGLPPALVALLAPHLDSARRVQTLRAQVRQQAARSALLQRLERSEPGALLGDSSATSALRRRLPAIGHAEVHTLIEGEPGTGRSLVGRLLHAQSPRSEQPLFHVEPHPRAIAALVEGPWGDPGARRADALAGHVLGGCTLLLRGVDLWPAPAQALLAARLRADTASGVLSASHPRCLLTLCNPPSRKAPEAAELAAAVGGRLRLSPLRDRMEDIPALASRFAEQTAARFGVARPRLALDFLQSLMRQRWPGNVRELRCSLERLTTLAIALTPATDPVLLTPDLHGRERDLLAPSGDAPRPSEPAGLRQRLDDVQRGIIREALVASGGSWRSAARELRVDPGNLHRRASRLGLLPGSDAWLREVRPPRL